MNEKPLIPLEAAWQAGSRYAALKRETHDSRATVVALLRERREAMKALARGVFPDGRPAFDKLCAAIRHDVAGFLEEISEARGNMRKLADGEAVARYLPGFYTGEKRLRDAFNEGAGEVILR